jgi:hypothetical protein
MFPELTNPSFDGDPISPALQIYSVLCCCVAFPGLIGGGLWFINKKWGKGDVFKVAEAIGGKELADTITEKIEHRLPPRQ